MISVNTLPEPAEPLRRALAAIRKNYAHRPLLLELMGEGPLSELDALGEKS